MFVDILSLPVLSEFVSPSILYFDIVGVVVLPVEVRPLHISGLIVIASFETGVLRVVSNCIVNVIWYCLEVPILRMRSFVESRCTATSNHGVDFDLTVVLIVINDDIIVFVGVSKEPCCSLIHSICIEISFLIVCSRESAPISAFDHRLLLVKGSGASLVESYFLFHTAINLIVDVTILLLKRC